MRTMLRAPWKRVRAASWPVAQAAVGAGAAWLLAGMLLDHAQPIFAPAAAIVALAARVGGRGSQAVEMLVGVTTGLVVGELLVVVLGTGAVEVALAGGAAMLLAAALVYSPLPLIQAGVTAVIIVALESPEAGGQRILDALIGAGVALFISQLLLSPSPVSLLSGAGGRALRTVADGLRANARALLDGDPEAGAAALTYLRGACDDSRNDVASARETGRKLARRTLRGRREADHLGYLDQRVRNIDLLLTSTLLLARTLHQGTRNGTAMPEWLHEAVGDLARAAEILAKGLSSHQAQSRAFSSAQRARRRLPGVSGEWESYAAAQVSWVAADLASLTEQADEDRETPD